jgi:hypothetical protein
MRDSINTKTQGHARFNTKTQSHVEWNTKTQSHVEWNTKTQSHVEWNTKTLWDAHSTQRHRGTETQREGLNITLKKFNRISRMVRINRIMVF